MDDRVASATACLENRSDDNLPLVQLRFHPPWVVILAGARARLESDAQEQFCQIRFLCHPPYTGNLLEQAIKAVTAN